MAEEVTITQADRSRAAFLHIQLNGSMPQKWLEDLREGRCDGDRIVLTLARHRLASTEALRAANEELTQQVKELEGWKVAEDAHHHRLRAEIAERDAEVARLREALAGIANRINVEGSPWHDAQIALDRVITAVKKDARQALQGQSDDKDARP